MAYDKTGPFVPRKVFNPLIDFLTSSAKGSLKQDSGSAYRYTQGYKLQLALLSGLGDLAVNLELHVENLLSLLNACTVYLSSLQPLPLQVLSRYALLWDLKF